MSRRRINRGRQRRQELQELAEELQLSRRSRSSAEQIAVLDERLGAGIGATRERQRLETLIKEPKNTKVKKTKNPKNSKRR